MIETEKEEYFEDLNKIKETIKNNQNKAMVVVNSAMIMAYYEIGTIINNRKTWGNRYIKSLANDLKEYGKGYSFESLCRMARFANEFSVDEIVSQAVTKIPWSTLTTVIVPKSSSHEERLWYINETYEHGWSRAMVSSQIAMKAYERSLIEPITSAPVKSNDLTRELFKDSYVLDFIDQKDKMNERDLKNRIIDNIIRFLNELGNGFALIGKEYRLTTPTGKEYYIDLLMYHAKVHAYVVIEVKMGEFRPEDYGQLKFYVKAMDKLEKTEVDEPTIGLLLCHEADKFTAETTLEGTLTKIGISKYKFIEELPEYLERKLKESEG